MIVMALSVAASLAFMASLRGDLRYFMASSEVVDLGTAMSLDPAHLQPDTYVRVRGTPMASGTVRYQRALLGTSYNVYPLAGQQNIFVQVESNGARADRQSSRDEFTGRLVTFGQLGGRFSAVRGYLERTMGMPVSSESFLVLDGEAPGSYGWSVAMALVALLFVVVNVVLLVRWFRPIPIDPADRDPDPA